MTEIGKGFCVVCGNNAEFKFITGLITAELQAAWGISDDLASAFNTREGLVCGNCNCSQRVRDLAGVLIQVGEKITGKTYPTLAELIQDDQFQKIRIAEINACGALYVQLKNLPNLSYSEFRQGVAPGDSEQGIRCEDIQNLTYPDNSFDIVLTSDTLEHIPDPEEAWQEIFRVLKPGGYHIFTIPVISTQPHSVRRAQFKQGSIVRILPPAYHGSSQSADFLVYTDFGMDIVDKLTQSGQPTEVYGLKNTREPEVNLVFCSQKQSVPITPKIEWTGERYVPWVDGSQIHYEHLHRYALAGELVRGKKVIDLASGEGYGPFMLSKNAFEVTGVDIDAQTVAHASEKYPAPNLRFINGSILDIPIEGSHIFDAAVCFEAIEHIAEHEKLLSEITRVLKTDGILVISSPNKLTYTDLPKYKNDYHVKELYLDDLRTLLQSKFKFVRFLGQRMYVGSYMWNIAPDARPDYQEFCLEHRHNGFKFTECDNKSPLYFVAVASNSELSMDAMAHHSALLDLSDTLMKDSHKQTSYYFNLVREREEQITGLQNQITRLNSQNAGLNDQLQLQHGGILYNLQKRYQRIIDKLLRQGSRRRYYYELGLSGVRVIVYEGWRVCWRRFWGKIRRRLGKPRNQARSGH